MCFTKKQENRQDRKQKTHLKQKNNVASGYQKHASNEEFPARNKTCSFYKKGHFQSVCYHTKKIKQVGDESQDTGSDTDDSSESYVSKVDDIPKGQSITLMKINTNGVEMLWHPDTGATKNIWDEKQFKRLQKDSNNPALEKTNARLYAYGSKKSLQVMGKFSETL